MTIKQHINRVLKGVESGVTRVTSVAVMRETTLSVIYQGFPCCFDLLNPFPEGVVERVEIRLRVEQDPATNKTLAGRQGSHLDQDLLKFSREHLLLA